MFIYSQGWKTEKNRFEMGVVETVEMWKVGTEKIRMVETAKHGKN